MATDEIHQEESVTIKIRNKLFELQDKKYKDFQSKLTPGISPDFFIGVRTPKLKSFAKDIIRNMNYDEFLLDLPHKFFDENQLHAFIISEIKDYKICLEEVEKFLPYVDNWATCDQLKPKIFKKHKTELLKSINIWINDDKTYTIRFGIEMLMNHYLDDDFDVSYASMVAKVRSEEYYVNMMIAWYFATALAKQYDSIIPFLEERRLSTWTHNKTIQKAVESYRIKPEQKEYLKKMKVKKTASVDKKIM